MNLAGNRLPISGRIAQRLSLRRWARLARQAETADLPTLRHLRQQALDLGARVNRVAQLAEGRLALPLIGADVVEAPLHSDWTWRPGVFRWPMPVPGIAAFGNDTPLGDDITVFHDSPTREMVLRQVRNRNEDDLAPFGLQLEVLDFQGAFLSLALRLPDAAVAGLKRRHLVRLDATLDCELPTEIFARLNVRHGPNTEQVVREFPRGSGRFELDFDLAYSNLNEKRVERAWIDLIFEAPAMNMVRLRDMVLSRRPRAEV